MYNELGKSILAEREVLAKALRWEEFGAIKKLMSGSEDRMDG